MKDEIDDILANLNRINKVISKVEEDSDYVVEDILENTTKKKPKNSGRKGKRGERGLVEIFKLRFPGKIFSRVVGSGAHGTRQILTEEAKAILTGDIVAPKDFVFSIESKHGYPEIDLCKCFDKGLAKLDDFLEQAARDAAKINKKPMLCWKKDRMPWLVFIRADDYNGLDDTSYHMRYREWVAVSLTELLSKQDSFFFEDVR